MKLFGRYKTLVSKIINEISELEKIQSKQSTLSFDAE